MPIDEEMDVQPSSIFKVPYDIPQDLLLIQDIVGPAKTPLTSKGSHHVPGLVTQADEDDGISSSGDEGQDEKITEKIVESNNINSEDEVEADLLTEKKREDTDPKDSFDSGPDSSSDDSSDSDSEPEQRQGLGPSSLSHTGQVGQTSSKKQPIDADTLNDDFDEETGATPAAAYVQTKNETVDVNILIPSTTSVGLDEELERVGEVASIVGDNVVIVKGVEAQQGFRAAGRTLDAETLLVLADRSVLGYVYETFGPTSAPLYQVKFNAQFPLDIARIRPQLEVFHVPSRSNFVFVEQIKRLGAKGSDASNIFDEEVGDDEREFSDDEEEAEWKRRNKRRGRSVVSSRQNTPAASRANSIPPDSDMFYGSNPYDEHGPYDADFSVDGGAGPSRPAPIPYDDPYAEPYDIDHVHSATVSMHSDQANKKNGSSGTSRGPPSEPLLPSMRSSSDRDWEMKSGRGRGRGRGRGQGRQSGRDGGSRGGRGSGRGGRGRDRDYHSRRSANGGSSPQAPPTHDTTMEEYDPRIPHALPTAQYSGSSSVGGTDADASPWSYNGFNSFSQMQPQGAGQSYQQPLSLPFVQPHINPRFAAQLGMNFNFAQANQHHWNSGASQHHHEQNVHGSSYDGYNYDPGVRASQHGWADQWTVPTSGAASSGDMNAGIYVTGRDPAQQNMPPPPS